MFKCQTEETEENNSVPQGGGGGCDGPIGAKRKVTAVAACQGESVGGSEVQVWTEENRAMCIRKKYNIYTTSAP